MQNLTQNLCEKMLLEFFLSKDNVQCRMTFFLFVHKRLRKGYVRKYTLQKDLETDEKKEIHFHYFCSRKTKTDCSLLIQIWNIFKTTIAFKITKK